MVKGQFQIRFIWKPDCWGGMLKELSEQRLTNKDLAYAKQLTQEIQLNKEESERFVKILLDPPEPNAELRKLMQETD